MAKYSRRRILRGLLNGSAVSVALPFLNCFLNANGTALASGAPMPVRFGTWFWGLGATNSISCLRRSAATMTCRRSWRRSSPFSNTSICSRT